MIRRISTMLLVAALLIHVALPAASAQQVLSQAVLVADLPKDAVYVGTEETEDGYTERLTTADGLASIIMLKRAGEHTADEVLQELYPEAVGAVAVEQAPIAAYPAVRMVFSLGSNEDTRAGVLVAFSTDTDTFALAVDVAADAYELNEDYRAMIEWWIESLDVFDGSAPTYTQPAGQVLTAALPDAAATEGAVVDEDGAYTQQYIVDEGIVSVILARRIGEWTAQTVLGDLFPDASGVTEVEQASLANFPASRLTFSLGENEDSRAGTLVVISTNGGTFALAVTVRLDDAQDYSDVVEEWISSLNLIEQ